MAGFVLLLNVVGWACSFSPSLSGTTLSARGGLRRRARRDRFLLGVRHAFDADHIAVIDHATRELVGEGKAGLGVGFWFALGHSSVVLGASLHIVLGVDAVEGAVRDETSTTAVTLDLIGSLVAGVFLLLIGLTNLVGSLELDVVGDLVVGLFLAPG